MHHKHEGTKMVYETFETFTGIIGEINDDFAIVKSQMNEGQPEGRILVDLSVNQHEHFVVGDLIKVQYDGTVNESDPAQINTRNVEKITGKKGRIYDE